MENHFVPPPPLPLFFFFVSLGSPSKRKGEEREGRKERDLLAYWGEKEEMVTERVDSVRFNEKVPILFVYVECLS